MKWLAVALIMVPVAIALTILGVPLWSWIESRWGIESLGHSGPAEWCYVATYAVGLAVALPLVSRYGRPIEPPPHSDF